jgi:hypothetical protein
MKPSSAYAGAAPTSTPGLQSRTSPSSNSSKEIGEMLDTLHKNGQNWQGVKRVSEWCQRGAKRVPKGCQNALVFSLKSDLRRSLRDGVFALTDYGCPQCRYRHLPASTHNAAVLGFCCEYECSGAYEPARAN